MLEVLRATPARRHIAVLGEMLELGTAAESLHRQTGRCAAASGLDMLIGVSGAARWMVEEAVRAGMPREYVRFFDRLLRSRRISSANWPAPATPFCSRAPEASKSSGPWRNYWPDHAVLPALRKTLDDFRTLPRLPLCHLAHRLSRA